MPAPDWGWDDGLRRAYLAGYHLGLSDGQRAASQKLAHEWLHDLTRNYAGLASAAAIAEQAEAV